MACVGPGTGREVEAYRGARLAALQTGMLKLAWEHDLRRVLTFHHRTMEAKAFGKLRKSPAVAKRYPGRLSTDWLSGEHEPERRRRVLGALSAWTSCTAARRSA
ncbi:hypothetical protein GT354_42905, partial [Streptomyces sp. SID3343]|nr:hypothetical protein [Streptomyces sp. SID3343]